VCYVGHSPTSTYQGASPCLAQPYSIFLHKNTPRCSPPCAGRGMAIFSRCTCYCCVLLAAIRPRLQPSCCARVPVSTVSYASIMLGHEAFRSTQTAKSRRRYGQPSCAPGSGVRWGHSSRPHRLPMAGVARGGVAPRWPWHSRLNMGVKYPLGPCDAGSTRWIGSGNGRS
jgi:hypothetical protein